MATLDTGTGTRLAAGSGRFTDVIWPDPAQAVLSSSAVTQSRNRLTNVSFAMSTGNFGTGGAGTLGVQYDSTLGVGVARLFSSASADGSGQIARFTPFPQVYWAALKTGGIPQAYNDSGFWRIYAALQWSTQISGGVTDSGLQVTTTGALFVAQSGAGFCFNRRANGIVSVSTVDVSGNAAVVNDVTAPPFDERQLHVYEFQLTSATQTAEAKLDCLVDGVLKLSIPGGVGSRLAINPSTNLGMTPQLVNIQKNCVLQCTQFRVIGAPTKLDAF